MSALRDAKSYGSRYASRVVVAAPQGSSYDGRRGVVARVEDDTVFVRFHPDRPAIPFGRGELKEA